MNVEVKDFVKTSVLADHYYPLLYLLGVQEKDEEAHFVNDKAVAGSLTMTSLLLA